MDKRHLVLQSKRAFDGPRFSVLNGEIRVISWHADGGPDGTPFIPRLVVQVREKATIDWGGTSVSPEFYEVLWDQDGKLPQQYLQPSWRRNERNCIRPACRSVNACQYWPACEAPMHPVVTP